MKKRYSSTRVELSSIQYKSTDTSFKQQQHVVDRRTILTPTEHIFLEKIRGEDCAHFLWNWVVRMISIILWIISTSKLSPQLTSSTTSIDYSSCWSIWRIHVVVRSHSKSQTISTPPNIIHTVASFAVTKPTTYNYEHARKKVTYLYPDECPDHGCIGLKPPPLDFLLLDDDVTFFFFFSFLLAGLSSFAVVVVAASFLLAFCNAAARSIFSCCCRRTLLISSSLDDDPDDPFWAKRCPPLDFPTGY